MLMREVVHVGLVVHELFLLRSVSQRFSRVVYGAV